MTLSNPICRKYVLFPIRGRGSAQLFDDEDCAAITRHTTTKTLALRRKHIHEHTSVLE